MYVVVIGNPFDGQSIIGPFSDHEEAEEWTDNCQDEWWIVEVTPK